MTRGLSEEGPTSSEIYHAFSHRNRSLQEVFEPSTVQAVQETPSNQEDVEEPVGESLDQVAVESTLNSQSGLDYSFLGTRDKPSLTQETEKEENVVEYSGVTSGSSELSTSSQPKPCLLPTCTQEEDSGLWRLTNSTLLAYNAMRGPGNHQISDGQDSMDFLSMNTSYRHIIGQGEIVAGDSYGIV